MLKLYITRFFQRLIGFFKLKLDIRNRKKYLNCWVFGHSVRGPLTVTNGVYIYDCTSCHRQIYFDNDRGWKVYARTMDRN